MTVPKVVPLPNLLSRLVASHGPANMNRYDGHGLAPPQATLEGGRYHSLPLEHANQNIIFHYKIVPVCGILIANKKITSPTSMIPSVHQMSSAPGTPGAPHAADDDRKKRGDSGGPGTAVISKTKPQVKKPSFYRVLLLNDDYTPMEFVVHVLERFFNKDREAATRIMLHVHHHGIGECGIYTYEVAETKVTQVMDFARKHQHPLQCVMEKK